MKYAPLTQTELKISSTPEEINVSNEKITIRILLEILKNPKAEPHEIGKSLREGGLKITDSFITNIFEKIRHTKKGVSISLVNDFLSLRREIPDEMSLMVIEAKILINFRNAICSCSICKRVLLVLKTQKTTIISLKYGVFYAVETLLFCPEHKVST